MDSFFGLNALDLLVILTMLFWIGFGFMQGLLRQVTDLGSLYLAFILAGQYHHIVGRWIAVSGSDRRMSNFAAFVGILILTFNILSLLARDAYKNTKLPIPGSLDRLGGMALGFISGCVWIALGVLAVRYVLIAPWPTWEGIKLVLKQVVQTSALVPIYVRLLPLIVTFLYPWLPRLPALFVFE
jgi:uncharacterized membrane protein required for colicin V production